jgi:membrane-associated phospholipid phosphatase
LKLACEIRINGIARRAGCRVNSTEQPESGGQVPVPSAGESEITGTSAGENHSPAAYRERGRLLHLGKLRPPDKVVVTYLAIVTILTLGTHDRVKFWWLLVPAHLLAMGFIFGLAHLDYVRDWPPKRPSIVRSWYPLILVPMTYKELGYLIPLIHPRDFDRELAFIDQRILGVDPIIWLDRINYPAVTLIMQLAYLTYYLMPIVLGIVLWRAGRFADFEFFLFMVLLGFYSSYLGYIAVPAIGPRFFLSPGAAKSLDGPGVIAIRSFLDRMEGTTRDCFPSGHTELTLLVLFCANRFHKKTFWILLPAGSALIISTVYLRYHYVVDVIAGAACAAVLALASDWLYQTAGGVSGVRRNA